MDPGTDPVGAWLRQLEEGDASALASLFDHYRPSLRRMVELRLDARAARRIDPSDVLQEVYLDAHRRVGGYLRRPAVDVYIWLRGLALERLLMLHRRHLGALCRDAECERALPSDSSLALARRLLTGPSGPSRAMMREELRRRVEAAIESLSVEDREMILMRHFEGMSNRQVAQMLELKDSTASMRYGRAILRLKEVLAARVERESSP